MRFTGKPTPSGLRFHGSWHNSILRLKSFPVMWSFVLLYETKHTTLSLGALCNPWGSRQAHQAG